MTFLQKSPLDAKNVFSANAFDNFLSLVMIIYPLWLAAKASSFSFSLYFNYFSESTAPIDLSIAGSNKVN